MPCQFITSACLVGGGEIFSFTGLLQPVAGFFIEGDALYASAIVTTGFVTNGTRLPSPLRGGNCPLFVMVGAMEERVCVKDGKMSHQKILPIRLSYDDRVEDGLTAGNVLKMWSQLSKTLQLFSRLILLTQSKPGRHARPIGIRQSRRIVL